MHFDLISQHRQLLHGDMMLSASDVLIYRGQFSGGRIELGGPLQDGRLQVWIWNTMSEARPGTAERIDAAVVRGEVKNGPVHGCIELAPSALVRLQMTPECLSGTQTVGIGSSSRTLELEVNADGYVDTLLEPGEYLIYCNSPHSCRVALSIAENQTTAATVTVG